MKAADAPVLDAMDERTRHRLLDRGVPRRLAKGETLHLAGERAERIHLVTSGVFKFVARDGSGGETILGIAAPGDVVGDIAAIDGMDQPVDAIAASDATVLGFDAELFMESVLSSRDACAALLRLEVARLRWTYGTTLERSAGGVPARVAGRLLDLADVIGRIEDGAVTFDLPFQQTELGRLAGVCRESACKTMRSFRSEGYVDYRGRELRILRPDMLEKIRCAGRA